MPAPKSLDKYPDEFFKISQYAALRGETSLYLGADADARAKMIRMNQLYNSWARLIERENHPHRVYTRLVSCGRLTVEAGSVAHLAGGKLPGYYLRWYKGGVLNSDREILQKAIPENLVPHYAPKPDLPDDPNLQSPTKVDLPREEDPNESALRKLGYFANIPNYKKDSQ